MERTKIIIMGAAGRDFHNFNTRNRDNERYEVVAFTATQIPNIDDRKYPAELAGRLYPAGIPIHPESELERLITQERIDAVVLAEQQTTGNRGTLELSTPPDTRAHRQSRRCGHWLQTVFRAIRENRPRRNCGPRCGDSSSA